jgi:hypothetical protein
MISGAAATNPQTRAPHQPNVSSSKAGFLRITLDDGVLSQLQPLRGTHNIVFLRSEVLDIWLPRVSDLLSYQKRSLVSETLIHAGCSRPQRRRIIQINNSPTSYLREPQWILRARHPQPFLPGLTLFWTLDHSQLDLSVRNPILDKSRCSAVYPFRRLSRGAQVL